MSKEYDILERIVTRKLDVDERVKKELALLKEAPSFIPEAMLKAFSVVCVERTMEAQPVNECHSEIAYRLGITTMPPGKMSFHYPVAPSALADIDSDFAYNQTVKDYAIQKYGADHVCNIGTYGKYKFKSLLKDLTRLFKDDDGERLIDLKEVNDLVKKLGIKIDADITVDEEDDKDEITFDNEHIQAFERKYPYVFEHFKSLYGLPKYAGQHAAGILILPEPFADLLPVRRNRDEFCCLTKDARILTNNGFRCITDISKGDTVFDREGNQQQVVDVLRFPNENSNLITVQPYFLEPIRMTQNHQVWATKDYITFNWVEASNLTTQHKVYVPKIAYSSSEQTFDMSDFASLSDEEYVFYSQRLQQKHHLSLHEMAKSTGLHRATVRSVLNGRGSEISIKSVNSYLRAHQETIKTYQWSNVVQMSMRRIIDCNENIAYLIGRWIGDGWLSKNKNRWAICFNSSDNDGITRIETILKSIGVAYKTETRPNHVFVIYSTAGPWVALFRHLFINYEYTSKTKYIPPIFKRLPLVVLTSLLHGYRDADGYIGKSGYAYTTNSKQLSEDLREICYLLGTPVKVRESFHARQGWFADKRVRYDICTPKSDSKQFFYKKCQDGYAVRIKSIETALPEDVFDITVEKSHCYLSSFVVHNSEWTEGQGVFELGSMGAIKIDLLGLNTLRVLDTANQTVVQRHNLNENSPSPCDCAQVGRECETNYKLPFMTRRDINGNTVHIIDLDRLCLHIPDIYKSICEGKNEGVFQFEPRGLTEFAKTYAPTEFYDLALITSLYRPGAMDCHLDADGMPIDPDNTKAYDAAKGAHTRFVERRHGRDKVTFTSPKLHDVLSKSMGLAVFQEDLSRIIMAMTGCDFAAAEKIRKFFTKVKPELLKTDAETIAKVRGMEENFVAESKRNGCTEQEAVATWNMILPFARYGFAKSHAISYSIISYETAFFRTFYPQEFFTALLSHNVAKEAKVLEYIRAAQKQGFVIRKPEINDSDVGFTIDKNGNIIAGLEMIKGVGEKAAALLVQGRNSKGPFTSIEDFLERDIEWRTVNRRVLESMCKAGCFDSISPNRHMAYAKIRIDRGAAKKTDYETVNLFDEEETANVRGRKNLEIVVEDWSDDEKLGLEREAFGFPFEDAITKNTDEVHRYFAMFQRVVASKGKSGMCGVIEDIFVKPDKNGNNMAFVSAKDLEGNKQKWVFFGRTYGQFGKLLHKNEAYFVFGKSDEKYKSMLIDGIETVSSFITLFNKVKTSKS